MVEMNVNGAVGEIVLNRPPVNAIDTAMVVSLSDAVDAVLAGPELRAVIVRGAGRMLSAGADITTISAMLEGPSGARKLREFARSLQRVYARIEALPVPTVAVVHGAATGGGLELALCCDIRVAANDSQLGLPEASIGLLPGAGGTQRLTAVAGAATALDLMLTTRLVTGAEAERLGIVQRAVPAEEVADAASALAAGLAGRSTAALAAIKRCVGTSPTGFELELNETERLAEVPETKRHLASFGTRRHQEADLPT